MAWWTIGDDELMIGDPVVDRLARQLRGIVEAREPRGVGPPTLGALLSVVADGLHRKAAMWCSGEPAPFRRLVARVQCPDEHVELVPADDALDRELAGQLAEAFEDIALIYEDVLDRRPRSKELLGVVYFLLSATPSDYVDVPAGTSVLELTAEDGDGGRRTG